MLGQQRNSAITWSGDIQGTWQVFKIKSPRDSTSPSRAFRSWNTRDTGGFFGKPLRHGNGNPQNAAYQELFCRWFQFSAFCPMFRVHGSYGTNPGKEIWRFDDNTQNIMRQYLDLRYRLMPYLYSVAWDVTANGQTFMRPLVMDFAGDAQALNVGDEYLFGPSILVTPVTTQGATTQSVYLPATKSHFRGSTSGQRTVCAGGQKTETDAPIETLPLYIRPGSIVPMGPFVQYSNEKPMDPLEIRVYPGANGTFTIV